ncbi:MAG: anaerobic ribonucleoside-triphosphate reductase activating protein [Clostridia bacterium]|nr:anaerobic ribonucleoside-triphosphate reductase activating protein [Clostridia bacterium]
MEIKGLQKLTLLDYPGKVATTVFTGGCNFRCPFCQNSDLVISPKLNPTLSEESVLEHIEKHKKMLDGVCISGGEPLLQQDLVRFILEIKRIGLLVKLDTNGHLFDKLRPIIEGRLVDSIAMDIKAAPENYGKLSGITNFDVKPILDSVDLIRTSGIDHEFRTTVVGDMHTEYDFECIGEWLSGEAHYFLQKFVDSGALIEDGHSPADDQTMHRYLDIVKKKIPEARLRGIE